MVASLPTACLAWADEFRSRADMERKYRLNVLKLLVGRKASRGRRPSAVMRFGRRSLFGLPRVEQEWERFSWKFHR